MPVVLVRDYFCFISPNPPPPPPAPRWFSYLRFFSVPGRTSRVGGEPFNMSRSVEEVSKLTESTYKVSACSPALRTTGAMRWRVERRERERKREMSAKSPGSTWTATPSAGELSRPFARVPCRGAITGASH